MNIAPISFQSNHYKSNYQRIAFPKIQTKKRGFDELTRRAQSDTTNPCWENISGYIHAVPKTKANTQSLMDYYQGNITHDEFLKQISYNNLCDSMRTCFETKKETQQKAAVIQRAFEEGGVDASNYEMALNLVDERELDPDVFIGIEKNGCFKDEFIEGLDKIFLMKSMGGGLKETYVPKFNTVLEVDKALKTGEVCILDGNENISIKTDKEIKELFITPETYLELFPPLQDIALCQGSMGDCFYIATLQSLYSNPKSRNTILEMFKENADGTLDVCLKGYKKQDDKTVLKDKNSVEIKDIEQQMKDYDHRRLALQYEAVRVLEMCADKTIKQEATNAIENQQELYSNLIPMLKNDDDYVEMDGFKYTKKEMELFLKILNEAEDKDLIVNNFISFDNALVNFKIDSKEFEDDALLDTTEASIEDAFCSETEKEYLLTILNRYKQYFLDNPQVRFRNLEGTIPSEPFRAMAGLEKPLDYLDGGDSSLVFKKLGLESTRLKDKDEIEKFFSQPDLKSNFAITASAGQLFNSPYIKPAHVYSLFDAKLGDLDTICANDPHNSAVDIMMLKDCAKDVFNNVYYTKL